MDIIKLRNFEQMFYIVRTMGDEYMKELIESYLHDAGAVKRRMDELALLITAETDTDKRKMLVSRRELLKNERYELLSDVSEMLRLETRYKACGDE